MGIEITPPGPDTPLALATSLTAHGSVTGPGAGSVITSVTAPPAGVYQVTVYAELSGTVAAADQDNLQLLANTLFVTRVPLSAIVAAGVAMSPFNINVSCNGVNNLVVESVIAGTGTAVYGVIVVATRVE